MNSSDIEILDAVHHWLEIGTAKVCLATVVHTFGSSPRPVGSMAAVTNDGRLVGSVSGGCIEADLLERASADFPSRATVLSYGVSGDEARRFGLPCGGKLELVWEPITSWSQLAMAREALHSRSLTVRMLDTQTGISGFIPHESEVETSFDGRFLHRVFGPRWRLLIIGANQIAAHLTDMAGALDYQVLLCDPRDEYAHSWSRPAIQIVSGMPDDVVREIKPDVRTAIVALTHDPKLDDMALLEALGSKAFYVGALGSRVSQSKRRERLLALDVKQEAVARLHGPVGLPIGSKSPAEIALAILAELTALRHGVVLDRVDASPVPAEYAPMQAVVA